MKQGIEEFIKQNKEAFDHHTPDAAIWNHVQQQTVIQKSKTKIRTLFHFRNVAAFIGTMVVGLALFLVYENKKLKEDLNAFQNKSGNAKSPEENVQYDSYLLINQFIKTVAYKQNQLTAIKKEYPSLYNEFHSDIKDLNDAFEGLKMELANVPEKEVLLEAMIQNLRLQAELLNKQLLIIQQLKQAKSNKNEKESTII